MFQFSRPHDADSRAPEDSCKEWEKTPAFVKSVEETFYYNRLTQEQIDSLEEHFRLGATTFVLVSFGLRDFYRVPWDVWRDMKGKFGRKYAMQEDLETCRVKMRQGIILKQ